MNHILFCSNCDEVVVKSCGSETKIRSKVLLIRDDASYIVCKGCGSEIELPLLLNKDLLKSMGKSDKVSLFIKS